MRTQHNLEIIYRQMDRIPKVNSAEFRNHFHVSRSATLHFMKLLAQCYPEQFDIEVQQVRGRPLYILHNKDYQS